MSTTETNTETPVVTNPCQREISVEIPEAVVLEQEKKIVANYQKHAKIPGFRAGKTPATIVKQRFNDDIKKDVIEALIPRYFREETKKQNFAPVSQPQITNLEWNAGEPLRFSASFEVMPTFEVTGYKDIKVEVEKPTVTDEDVENTVKNIQEQKAKFTDVEGDAAIQDGDYAVVSFKGTSEKEGSEPIEMKEVLVGIGHKDTVKEFTENLLGAKPGDQKSFDVVYAEDFSEKRLAGQKIHYEVEIKGIQQKDLPELNDEFASSLAPDLKTMEELRTRIREQMLHEKTHQAEHSAKDKIVDELIKRYEFPVPVSLVEHQIDQRLERGFQALAQQGLDPRQFQNMDMTRLRTAQRDGAVREVKTTMLLEKVAELEKIEISDEDLNKEVEAIANQMQQPVDGIRARLEQSGGLENIRFRMRQDKTLAALYQQSL